VDRPHSTGRGGSGNIKIGPDLTSTEREQRFSTAPKTSEAAFGRGGAGNIEAARALQRRQEEEKARKEAQAVEKARAHAKAAAEAAAGSIQYPKPTRSI
jgi:Protein of unknown function (DUF3602)